jgi:hypothetical protein
VLPDPVAEADRVMRAADREGVTLRAIGGVAIALHGHGAVPPSLQRSYGDIDLVTTRRGGPDTLQLLRELGYQPNERFNALNGDSRLVVYDLAHDRHVDIFVGEFRMCHVVPLTDRLELESRTAPLAELLLTKLQVVEANRKDVGDMIALLLEHEVGAGDAETVNSDHIAALLAADWGFWRTFKGSIQGVRAALSEWSLDATQQATVVARLARLWADVEAAPKTLRWRTRAKVGDRVRWYELPEEIDHPDADRR